MNPRTSLSKIRHSAAEPLPSATVIALPRAAARRFRREASADADPFGQILLFTGVRYERMPEAESEPTIRQRKRS